MSITQVYHFIVPKLDCNKIIDMEFIKMSTQTFFHSFPPLPPTIFLLKTFDTEEDNVLDPF